MVWNFRCFDLRSRVCAVAPHRALPPLPPSVSWLHKEVVLARMSQTGVMLEQYSIESTYLEALQPYYSLGFFEC